MHKCLSPLIALTLASSFAASSVSAAELLLTGGTVYTLNPNQPYADALLISDETIVFVGSQSDAEGMATADAVRVDLGGGIAIPGLVDAHAHINNLSKYLTQLQLIGTKSISEVREKALAAAKEIAPGEWIQGRGWDQNDWEAKEFPTYHDLSGLDDHPVYFRRVDGHACLVNKRALEICGITRDTPDPEGGRIVRDVSGEPTGVFIDNGEGLITAHISEPSHEEMTRRFKLAFAECNRLGLTGVHDAGLSQSNIDAYNALADENAMTLRIYGMLSSSVGALTKSYLAKGPQSEAGGRLSIRAVKAYGDGALGSRGAALLAPYDDDPDNSGLMVTAPDSLKALALACAESGFQLCVHAIGDRAVRNSLDAFAFAQEKSDKSDLRNRIEHSQVIALEDLPRYAALGVIAAYQPTHCTSDMYWAEDRIGSKRILGAYAWRRMLDSGARIALGSDFPVESVNPLWGIYAAVSRQDHKGWPESGWYADQVLTVEEAVRGFTTDAAYASFSEETAGSLEVGKYGDITVLDTDIFSLESGELQRILETNVLYTIVGGKVVYTGAVK